MIDLPGTSGRRPEPSHLQTPVALGFELELGERVLSLRLRPLSATLVQPLTLPCQRHAFHMLARFRLCVPL